MYLFFFFLSSSRRHTRSLRDWSSDVCSSDLRANRAALVNLVRYEIENTLGRVGLASAEEVASLRQRITELERAAARDRAGSAEAAAAGPNTARATKKATKKAATTKATPAKPAKA